MRNMGVQGLTSLRLYSFYPTKINVGKGSCSRKAYAAAVPQPSQGEKEKESSQETSDKTMEAAEAVKDGADEVKQTAKFIRTAAASTATTVNKMAKQVSEKVSETTDAFKGKATESIMSGVWSTAKSASQAIKDKVNGK